MIKAIVETVQFTRVHMKSSYADLKLGEAFLDENYASAEKVCKAVDIDLYEFNAKTKEIVLNSKTIELPVLEEKLPVEEKPVELPVEEKPAQS